MKAFTWVRPPSFAAAAGLAQDGALPKAGGSDLLDRMKERLDTPDRVVALHETPEAALRRIEVDLVAGVLRIGALVTLAEIAASADVKRHLLALSEAAAHAASPQVRHRATLGGNLAQHTRCGYYRLLSFPCWKRGADACPVLADGAVQDTAGIFGNASCASAHPASLPPVLGAARATVVVRTADGVVRRPFEALWAAPQQGVASDLALAPGELIEAVETPLGADLVVYEEVRQKAAFDWALVSCAVRLTRDAAGKIASAGVWLGSVAPTPHRAAAAETALAGADLAAADIDAAIDAAAEAASSGATPLPGNTFKVDLVRVVVRRALRRAAGRN